MDNFRHEMKFNDIRLAIFHKNFFNSFKKAFATLEEFR